MTSAKDLGDFMVTQVPALRCLTHKVNLNTGSQYFPVWDLFSSPALSTLRRAQPLTPNTVQVRRTRGLSLLCLRLYYAREGQCLSMRRYSSVTSHSGIVINILDQSSYQIMIKKWSVIFHIFPLTVGTRLFKQTIICSVLVCNSIKHSLITRKVARFSLSEVVSHYNKGQCQEVRLRSEGQTLNNVFMGWSFYHEFINNINISNILTISLFATGRSSAETIMKTGQ